MSLLCYFRIRNKVNNRLNVMRYYLIPRNKHLLHRKKKKKKILFFRIFRAYGQAKYQLGPPSPPYGRYGRKGENRPTWGARKKKTLFFLKNDF